MIGHYFSLMRVSLLTRLPYFFVKCFVCLPVICAFDNLESLYFLSLFQDRTTTTSTLLLLHLTIVESLTLDVPSFTSYA